jgi:hypothetical protein
MPGRVFNSSSYRFSINGQEKSPEIAPNTTTAEYWQYDSRIVRRWNVDPRPSVDISVYASFGNNPIINSDPLGDTTITRPDGVKDDMPDFGKVNSLSTPGNVAGTNVPANHTEGAVESFTIGNRTFRANYYAPTGTFTGYKCGDLYYNYKSYINAIDAVGDYDLTVSLINSGYSPEQLIDVARRNAAIQAYLNRSPVKDFFKGFVNDVYVTGRAMFSGPLGLSKTGFSDLEGNTVGYNQRISAGINTLSSFVPMSGAPKGVNFMYSAGGYKIFGTKFFRLDSRLTNIGVEGLGHGQFDAAHRAVAYLREDILQKGSIGFKNQSTMFLNYSTNGQNFSIGINPWTRTIFHEGPGVFK